MTALAQGRTVEQWLAILNGRCQRIMDNAVSEFVALGADLIEAKSSLAHGEWQKVLEGFRFGEGTARKLIRINKWLHKGTTKDIQNSLMSNLVDLLPPDYNTIDQITRLEPETLKRLVEDKTISPALSRNDVTRILNDERIKQDESRVLKLRARPGKYRTIILDPAWDYDAYSPTSHGRPSYATQSIEELEKLNLREWAEDECHLYCWVTNAYVAKACKLIEHWGFEYKSILTWVKPPPFGMGRYFRNATEKVLFATIGGRTTRANDLPDYFEGARGEHSEKPESFYDIVRQASYPPYGEANQRKFRPDFTDLFMSGEPLQAAI